VIEELVAWSQDHLSRPEAFFWRTHAGAEVDLLLAHGRRLVPIEVKLGVAVGPREVAGLRQCMTDLGLRRGFVVYGGDEPRRLGGGIELLPWAAVARGEIDLPL
jgi:predicted AAA+ superfamily ATPase